MTKKEKMNKFIHVGMVSSYLQLIEGKGCTVVFRAGEDVRCQHYCRVNSFCDYFKEKSVEFQC